MKNLFFKAAAMCAIGFVSLSASAQQVQEANSKMYAKTNSATPKSTTVRILEYASPVFSSMLTAGKMIFNAATAAEAGSANATLLTEQCKKYQFKFAQLLNRDVETLSNTKLFGFIDEWWHTRYRYGGTSKLGIDCSAFTGLLMNSVFAFHLPRTAREQYKVCNKVQKEQLAEGDLVFFNTTGGVSHVGFYLGGGYFVHASVSQGITINNLDETYYKSRFIGGGRVAPGTQLAAN